MTLIRRLARSSWPNAIGRLRPAWGAGGGAWRALALGVALGATGLLALPTSIGAAMWVRVQVEPAQPRAGQAAKVSVLTFYLTEQRCADDPAAKPIPHAEWTSIGPQSLDLRMAAYGPSASSVVQIPLERRISDPTYWDGSIVFPAPGQWTLRVTRPEFGGNEACLGARAVVTVQPSATAGEGSRPGVNPVALGLFAASALCVWVLGLVVARMRRVRALVVASSGGNP
jgi:hypothetical protein